MPKRLALLALLLTAQAHAAGVSFDLASQAALKGMQPSPIAASKGMKGFVFAERTPSPGVLVGYVQGNKVSRVVVEGRVPTNTVMPPYVFNVAAIFTGKWCDWEDDDSIYSSMIKSYFNAVKAPLEPRSFRAGTCVVAVAVSGQAYDARFTITQVSGPPVAPPVQVTARSQPAPAKPAAPQTNAPKLEALKLLGSFAFSSPTTVFTLTGDGKQLVTGHHNGQVVVWDIATQKTVHVYSPEQRGAIEVLAISPSAGLLAVKDSSGYVTVFRSNGTQLAQYLVSNKNAGVAFSPDGTLLAFVDEHGLQLSSVLNDVDVFAPYQTYDSFSGPVAFTADSKGLFGMSSEIKRINLSNGIRSRIAGEDYEFLSVDSLIFSHDRSRFLINFRDSYSFSVVNTADMKLIREFSEGPATLSRDGRQVLRVINAGHDGGVEVLDVDSGGALRRVNTPGSGPAISLTLTADGNKLMTLQNGLIRLWSWTGK